MGEEKKLKSKFMSLKMKSITKEKNEISLKIRDLQS